MPNGSHFFLHDNIYLLSGRSYNIKKGPHKQPFCWPNTQPAFKQVQQDLSMNEDDAGGRQQDDQFVDGLR